MERGAKFSATRCDPVCCELRNRDDPRVPDRSLAVLSGVCRRLRNMAVGRVFHGATVGMDSQEMALEALVAPLHRIRANHRNI